MAQIHHCPDCSTRLVFSGDGRQLLCERCGYNRPVGGRARENIQELIRLRRAMSGARPTGRSMRPSLKQGIGEFHDGRPAVARSHFERVILKTGSHEEEEEAWLWLSRVVEDHTEKRLCLEAVLAINPTNGEARRELAIVDGRISPADLVGNPAPPAENGQDARAQQIACPRCTAPMAFSPEAGRLLCPYCGHEEDVPEAVGPGHDEQFGQGALEQDFDAAVHTRRGHTRPVAMRVLRCQGCATEFVLGPELLSMTCPYCASEYVTAAAETAELLPPQGVIPFAVTEEEAQAALSAWFVGQKIRREEITRLSQLGGMYIPAWTFDIGGEVRWRGRVSRGDLRTGGRMAVTVTNSKYVFYDDFLVLAMTHQAKPFLRLLESYDLTRLVPYDGRLLTAWPAERYTVPLARAAAWARGRIGQRLRRLHHGLDSHGEIEPNSVRCQTDGVIVESYKLLLLPVWTLHYQRRGEPFELLVNGQTGEVFGREEAGLFARLATWVRGG